MAGLPYGVYLLGKAGFSRLAPIAAGDRWLGVVAILSLAIPLAFSMAVSVSVLDILVWGGVTVVILLVVYRIIDFLLKDLPARIENGEIGAAILLSSVKLAVAAITAAAVSG